jgi:hypothetical protein
MVSLFLEDVFMESWRRTWRLGFAPLLSERALLGLLKALQCNDVRLVQGSTTIPPPLFCTAGWPVEAGCALGYSIACDRGGLVPPPSCDRSLAYDSQQAKELACIGEVEEEFSRLCHECDKALGESAGCRWFLNWFDDTERDEMIRNMIPEVQWALARKR